MNAEPTDFKSKGGWGRLVRAMGYSAAGFRHAFRHEAAFRQELAAFAILTPIAVLLPITRLERLILLLSMLVVVLVELINSALEATIDRISTDRHPLSGRAKDLGSAAVMASLALAVLTWVVALLP